MKLNEVFEPSDDFDQEAFSKRAVKAAKYLEKKGHKKLAKSIFQKHRPSTAGAMIRHALKKDPNADVSQYEKTIATNHRHAFEYAKKVKKGPWPPGEAAIATHPWYAYQYAKNILNGRFAQGEPTIVKYPWWAEMYAHNVLHKRWPEAEAAIAKDPNPALEYAVHVIKGRFPEGEPAILSNQRTATNYRALLRKLKIPLPPEFK